MGETQCAVNVEVEICLCGVYYNLPSFLNGFMKMGTVGMFNKLEAQPIVHYQETKLRFHVGKTERLSIR